MHASQTTTQKGLTEERLANVGDPQVACLLLQAEVASVIKFMSGEEFKHLGITNVSVVSRSLDSPISGDRDATDSNETLHFSRLGIVQVMETEFFVNCNMLTAMDLSEVTNVTTIHDGFLRGCTGLTTLDLSGLTSVTTIGHNFMYNCVAIRTLDLSVLTNITSIGDNFMHSCSAMHGLDLCGFAKVKTIGSHFLYNCTGLTRLDLSALRRVSQITGSFLGGCQARVTYNNALPYRHSSIVVMKNTPYCLQ